MTDKLLQALSQFGLQNTLLHSLSSQAAEEGSPLDALLLERGLLNEENLLEALAAATELKPVNLNHFYPDFSLAKLLLPEWCQQHCCVPLCEEDEALHVAVGYPPRLEALEAFSLRVGRKLLPWIAIECRIQQWLAALYGLPISQHTFALLEKLSQNPLPPPPASENIPPIPSETLLPPNEETLPPPTTSTPPLPPEVNPAPMPTAARENTAAQSHRAPPFKEPRPVAQASNVFRDFFVKVKQQLWPKRETPPPNLTPPLTLPPLPPIEPPLPPAPLPAFSAVDEGPFGQNLFEEFFANIPTPLPRLEKSTLTPPVENVPVPPEENASTPPEENASVPPVENASAPPEENASTPPERNALVPPVENASAPPERNALVPPEENASVPPEENASVPLPITLVENTPLPPPTLVENTSTPPVENIPAPPEANIPPPPPPGKGPGPPPRTAPTPPPPPPPPPSKNP
ncbi:MAG: hypothetical protein FWD46_08200, partial [Cystobacterineae bacterium]|nr:hypothetical protein [Cystobacterineae bacterium]